MPNDQMNKTQIAHLERATAVTRAQIVVVAELVAAMGISQNEETELAMLQVLATNYLAERTKS